MILKSLCVIDQTKTGEVIPQLYRKTRRVLQEIGQKYEQSLSACKWLFLSGKVLGKSHIQEYKRGGKSSR
jgi:hypothetical protein